MNHFAIPETNVQHCTLTISQFKNGLKKTKHLFWVLLYGRYKTKPESQ